MQVSTLCSHYAKKTSNVAHIPDRRPPNLAKQALWCDSKHTYAQMMNQSSPDGMMHIAPLLELSCKQNAADSLLESSDRRRGLQDNNQNIDLLA